MSNSKDVALKANVSVATVSRVYKSPELVKPATRELVLKAAKELNYYPNLFARNLKEQRSNSIGIAVCDFTNPFFFQVFEQLNLHIDKTNYQMMVFPPINSKISENKMAEFLLSNQIDAFLFTPTVYHAEDHTLLSNSSQYCLQLYSDIYPDIDAITIDDQYGTYLAVKHLLEHQHTKILLLNSGDSDEACRMDGVLQAYHEFDLEPDLNYFQYLSHDTDEQTAIQHLIKTLKPSAIISHTERLTIFTLSALTKLNLSQPNDISLITYDDHPWAAIMGITAISQPISQIAAVIANTVLDTLSSSKKGALRKQKIKPTLIERKSVSSFSKK